MRSSSATDKLLSVIEEHDEYAFSLGLLDINACRGICTPDENRLLSHERFKEGSSSSCN